MPDTNFAEAAHGGGAEIASAPPTPIVIVGHVDHGKSTLIGRLLHDTGNLEAGRLAAAVASSARRGLAMEWSFLLDSLQAERDQGVTIDSTRLAFRLDHRRFVIIDAPGHRQFVGNMLTGAAGAAAAVLVVDLAEGVQEQTRRHAMLLRLIGVQHVIVLLNKADLLDYDQRQIESVADAVSRLLARLEIRPAATIPAAAREGENIAVRAPSMPWYSGPTFTEALSAVPPPVPLADGPLRLPVQDVYRLGERRVVVGRLDSGTLHRGEAVVIGTEGTTARIASIEAWPGPAPEHAVAGQSVAITLAPDVVVERGDLLHRPAEPPLRATRLRARVFWLRQQPLRAGEQFRLRLATAEFPATVAAIDSVLQLDALTEQAAAEVPAEGFGEVTLTVPGGVSFDPFAPGGTAGRGVLVDGWQRIVAAAPLLGPAALPAGRAVFPVESTISAADRARVKGHRSGVFWLTGLPGAGKTTVARAVESLLFARGVDVVLVDGDTLRAHLNADLGFSARDRDENVRRAAAVARMMADAGMVVLVALISPHAEGRVRARATVGGNFHEVFVKADAATCEARDPKGLYAAARAGRIASFTGIDNSYEAPVHPDLVLDTAIEPATTSAARLVAYIERAIL